VSVTKIIKIRNNDIGRPFTELVTDLRYPGIESDAHEVILSLISVERATESKDNRWFNVRIMPYRTVDDRIDGLVITFTDISLAKKLEAEVEILREQLKHK
jgi:two-component system CheB/CheR fusion protein